MRTALVVALLALAALVAAQDQVNGLAAALGSGNPFTNDAARSLQFGQNSKTEVDFCLGRDVTFGGDTTFESWIYPTKADGAIFTAVTLDGTGAPYNDDTISFRLANWGLQLYLGGYPIGDPRTNPATLTSVRVGTPNMIQANTWTHVFGTVSVKADATTVCAYALQLGSTVINGGCINANIAWPTKARSHLYVGDAGILGLENFNFRGLMENLRIWRKAFSSADILALTTVAAKDPGVVASWNFDECPIVGNKVTTVSDTSGSNAPIQLNCGNNDPAKQPICARTNAPVTQAGGWETNPPIVGNLGSGNTIKPTPPPTTKPPTTPPKCPKPPNADFWGDPHFHLNGGPQVDFQGEGWFWAARTDNWAKEQFGVQLFYKRCNGKYTCGEGVAWINKRELGWFKYGEALGLKQDANSIPFKGPVMTTPAGTQIEQRGSSITVTVPGYFTLSGDDDQWEFKWDDKFENKLADGSCAPVNDKLFGQRPVATGDLYYKGTSPPPCLDCPVPPALQPPVCPQAAAGGAACDGPDGVPCKWADRCNCIAQTCWNTDLVSVERRRACLVDTSGTTPFDPATAVPSIQKTWDDCIQALKVFQATNPAVDAPGYAAYKCYKATPCPKWCSGPCQGTCDIKTGSCNCKAGFGGNDCSQKVGGKKRQFDETSNLIVAQVEQYYSASALYAYDANAKTAAAANPIAAPKSASFFVHTQVPPQYSLGPGTLNAGDDPVNSFGIIVNSANSPFSGKLAVSLKLLTPDRAPITGAAVLIKDDPSDTYSWNSATGTGSFSWNFAASGSAGVVLNQIPTGDFCAEVTITSATGVDRYFAVSNEVSDVSVPILNSLPVSAGSTFTICSAAPADSCLAHGDATSCNAVAECGWCASTSTCHRGDEVGPYYASCTVWRSEIDPTVSRLVESVRDTTLNVRTTQLRTYLAPDNAQLTVPVEVRLPTTVGSFAFQVRGLFEFTDQMAPFVKFLGSDGASIINGINAASPGSLFGVSSFRDKAHVRPHGRTGDWIYKEHVAFQKTDISPSTFTSEWATWASSPSLVGDWQADLGLGTLEALFHEVHQGWPLHPATGTKNVVLIFTKSPVAQPGILVSAADSPAVELGQPLPANNLDQVIDDYEDYPALINVATVLLGRGIIPVFVVPDAVGNEAVVASYRTLISKLGFGKVWPDVTGRNALKSTMTSAQASAVITSILADLATSVQIVASNPAVTSTLASPVLFNGDNYPLGAVVRVPITLQRQTAASRKRDLDSDLFRLFYRDRQMVTVVGLGQFEVVSTTTDAPSAEDKEFSINVDEADPVAHVLALPSWSVYDQNMKGYIVTRPAGASLFNILAGASPEAKGTAVVASGLIEDSLHRVFIDIPAGAVGDSKNGYLYSSFTYKMVDSAGMESRIATVNIRVVPAGMHAPIRYEPTADFLAQVNENTKWAPTSTLVCVGGLDYDPQSTISVKITRPPTEGTLYKIVDSKGTPGAVVQTNDIVSDTFGARPAPAVGCFVYVPPVRSPGMETPYGPGFGNFQWVLIDNTGLTSAVETTEIDVLPVNYPPVTEDATVTGWENTDLNINLVASDDPRPDGINNNNVAVAVKISAVPARGTLKTKEGATISSLNPTVVLSLSNGIPVSVVYTPDANVHSDVDSTGSLAIFDYFTYTATDAGGLSSTATVRILINPANALPVVQFSDPTWTFPVARVGSEPSSKICLAVSNLRDAASTTVYITSLPKKGTVSVNGVAASSTPVAIASTSAGNAGTWCFDYNSKKAGTDSLDVKVCAGCPAPTDAMFSNYLNGAPTQTITVQVGSQKGAGSSGLSKGGVVAVAIVGSLLGLALLGVLGFMVFRSKGSSGSSGNNLKAPLL